MDIDYTFAQMLYLCIAPRTGQQSQLQFQSGDAAFCFHVFRSSFDLVIFDASFNTVGFQYSSNQPETVFFCLA